MNYHHDIGIPPDVPEPPFWVEWRVASNNAIHIFTTDDATFVVDYRGIHNLLDMYGDAVISRDGGTIAFNLPLDQFRTFRFETISDEMYCYWYDGKLFQCNQNDHAETGLDYIQFWGHGGVDANQGPGPIINRWDYVRYGRVTTGEAIVASNPSGGQLDAAQFLNLDRFTVTFDQPNYVYVADITVEVLPNHYRDNEPRTSGRATLSNQYRDREGAVSNVDQRTTRSDSLDNRQSQIDNPIVIATRRQDNGPPDTVEIVLNRPLTIADGTVRFTFNTGATNPQIVQYTLIEFQPCCLSGGTCESLAPQDCSDQGGLPATSVCEGDVDHDGIDGTCGDACPTDPTKLSPGECGCGISEIDFDLDTVPDCHDQCPGHDDRIDSNADGIPDCLASAIPTMSCWGLVIFTLLLFVAAKILQVASPTSARQGGWPRL